MAAVRQQVLNWLYSVLTSVSYGDAPVMEQPLNKFRNIQM
jgi:hypothetical protein